jgi:hypothetical protein
MKCKDETYDAFMGIKNAMRNKYGETLPKRLTFIVTDEDLFLLKLYKQYLEWNLERVNKTLRLFESKEE